MERKKIEPGRSRSPKGVGALTILFIKIKCLPILESQCRQHVPQQRAPASRRTGPNRGLAPAAPVDVAAAAAAT